MIQKISLSMIFQFLLLSAFAQSQDTILIVDEPVVIHKQVIIELPKEKTSLTIDLTDFYFAAGLYYGTYDALQVQDSLKKSFSPFFSPTFQVGKIINEQIDFSIGLTRFSSNLKINFTDTYYQYEEVQKESYDTVGVNINPGGITYNIDTTRYSEMENVEYKKASTSEDRIRFWSVPIQLGYRFTNNNWYLQPLVALNFNFSNRSLFRNSKTEIAMPKSFFSGTFGGELGINLSDQMALEFGILATKQLNKKESHLIHDQIKGRFQIKYIF